jgi:hypothetical protein
VKVEVTRSMNLLVEFEVRSWGEASRVTACHVTAVPRLSTVKTLELLPSQNSMCQDLSIAPYHNHLFKFMCFRSVNSLDNCHRPRQPPPQAILPPVCSNPPCQ